MNPNSPAAKDPKSSPRARTVVRVPITLRDGLIVDAHFISFDNLRDGLGHFALRFGSLPSTEPLVRVHSECITGDVFGSTRCDCDPQLDEALQRLHEQGGYLLYMRQEGRGIGLLAKLDAYRLQEQGLDTYEANRRLGFKDDQRDYGAAVDMLTALGIERISLLSNNPDKRQQLEAAGITVQAQIPTGVYQGPENLRYLMAKVRHTRHTIDLGVEHFHSATHNPRPES